MPKKKIIMTDTLRPLIQRDMPHPAKMYEDIVVDWRKYQTLEEVAIIEADPKFTPRPEKFPKIEKTEKE